MFFHNVPIGSQTHFPSSLWGEGWEVKEIELKKLSHSRLGVGLGLRSCHYDWVLRNRPPVSWFEIISENFMIPGGKPLRILNQVREHYPVALHGVSMSLGSNDPTPPSYLQKLKTLIDRIQPLWVSDHLCWTGIHGYNGHDLWPLPYTDEAVSHVAKKISEVQEYLGRQILIENLSTYVAFQHSEMTEWEFLKEVAERADCGILLDLNNIYVSAYNHQFDSHLYVDSIPAERVFEIHLAGPSRRGNILVDTHDHPVAPEAWELYEYFLNRSGPRPTLLEWDEHIPSFPVLYDEAMKAQHYLQKLFGISPEKKRAGVV